MRQALGVTLALEHPDDDGGPPPPSVAPLDFREVFETESDYVWRSLHRLGVRERDLPDVTHDVFVVVYRHLSDYDPARPLRPWLFGIAARLAANYRRRQHATSVAPETLEDVADQGTPADERLASRQALAQVGRALDELDPDRRAVFVMHDLDGHAMPEIAAALGVPLNTAYSRLRLGREQFSAALRRARLQRGER